MTVDDEKNDNYDRDRHDRHDLDDRHHDDHNDSDHPFQADDYSTPLTEEEKKGLIPSWVTFRFELNEVEEANIAKAMIWCRRVRRDILDDSYLRELHRRMLGEVWRWAGQYRLTERNLGITPWNIPLQIKALLDDVRYWIENATYEPDEIAIRFHHRLVFIHPFSNGNGRHSRLMADLLVQQLGHPPFTWGEANIAAQGELRRRYIEALQDADHHNYKALLAFARS